MPHRAGPVADSELVEIAVNAEQQNESQPALVHAVLGAPPNEQQLLLAWSRGLGAIRRGDLPPREKAAAILTLTREHQAGWPLVKVMARAMKHILWDARSWKLRLGVLAVIATFATVGQASAGIVSLGAGIGLPLWLIIGAGGVLAGAVADLVTRKIRRPRG
jgi:hypothetical protein